MAYEIALTVSDNIKNRVVFEDQRVEIVKPRKYADAFDDMLLIEKMGRLCYASEPKGAPEKFIRGIISKSHLSVIEHASMSVIINCSRVTSHQLVRHRLSSFSQASFRYINFDKTDDTKIIFCNPVPAWPAALDGVYRGTCIQAFNAYCDIIGSGVEPDRARMCLPDGTMTTLGMTANLREWRHIFQLRLDRGASMAIRHIMRDLFTKAVEMYPCVFGDIELPEDLQ